MSDTNVHNTLEEVSQHLATGLDHHAEARSTHADVRIGIKRMRTLATRALTAHAQGDTAALKRSLEALGAEGALTTQRHEDTTSSHRAVGRAIESAQECVMRAALEAKPAGINPIANPSGATGAQTSAGQSPRAYDRESVRQRDQLAGIRAAADFRSRLEERRR